MNNYLLKNNLMKYKKIIIKSIILLCISILFSLFATTAKSINLLSLLKDSISSYLVRGEKVINLEDFVLSGYDINGETISTTSEDSTMVLNNNLNYKISNLTINYKEPLKNDMDIQIYYTNNGSNFNEKQLILSESKIGDTSTKIKVNMFIEKLRIDIGAQKNLNFSLASIVINNKNDRMTISDIAYTFLSCLGNKSTYNSIWFDRFSIFFFLSVFIGLHFIFSTNKMYAFIFTRRWLFALLILIYLVGNKYHGDSMSLYDSYAHIQEGQGSEYIHPVFGTPRAIRTDEWVVDNPYQLSSQFGDTPFSKYNNVMRGTATLNSILGVYGGYSTLGKSPFLLAYLFMDTEYAFSFNWFAPMILLFMVSIEVFLIISNRKKLLSVTGAFLIVFSSFYLWWVFPIQLLSAQGAIVCAYYFLQNKNKLLKAAYGIGTAIGASMFITNLYPAWQVPLGYTVLCILIWMIHDNWKMVKSLDKKDWIIFGLSLLFLVTLVGTYFYDISEYTQSITQTIYPGTRHVNGGYALNKIFYYFHSILYPYKYMDNPSEGSVFLSFFPTPMICAAYLWIKDKRKDWLTGSLIILSCILLLYSTIELNSFIANITLLSYSTPKRVIDIVGFIQIYFIIIIFSRFEGIKKIHPIKGAIIGVMTAFISMLTSIKYYPGYASKAYIIVAFIVISLICYCMLTDISTKVLKRVLISLIAISLLTGLTVRPLVKGLDAIYSKPVASKITDIMEKDKDAKWIAYGGSFILPGFAVACGAPTINSVNIYPNLKLWYNLDVDKKYEEIYNRFAHINLNFIKNDTSMELIQADYFTLNLSYKDIYKTGARYILSLSKLEKSPINNVSFELIYDEYNCYIYKINYMQ